MPRQAGIYLDHAATAPALPAVVEAMVSAMQRAPGNASAVHRAGVRAALHVENARAAIAQRLGAAPSELSFTSGGTEANNWAVKGLATARGRTRGHLVTTAIEHPSVAEPLRWLVQRGFEATTLPVDGQGFVEPDDLRRALRPDTVLVSVIHGNNEVGTVQDLKALGSVCRQAGVPLHVDACQSFTKVPLDVSTLPVDLVTVNAHKLHGPQGVGALWVRPGLDLEPWQHGGDQEQGQRSGTLHVAGIVGFGKAVELATPERLEGLRRLRERFVARIERRLPMARVNGPQAGALPHVLSVSFPGVEGKALFQALNRQGFQLSLGSACKAGSTDPSPILLALGLSAADARSTLRISPGYDTRDDDLEALLLALERTLPDLAP